MSNPSSRGTTPAKLNAGMTDEVLAPLHSQGNCLQSWPHEGVCTDLHDGTTLRVCDLRPGDVIENIGIRATFITHTAHPLYMALRLVVWYLDIDEYSFDALSLGQEVGQRKEMGFRDRVLGLRAALGQQVALGPGFPKEKK